MKNKKGFTLMEMMAVVIIIAGLAAIAYPTYTRAINRARTAEAFSLIEIVREAQQRSFVVNGAHFFTFTPAHVSGRTRLIKTNDAIVENGQLKRGLYTVRVLRQLEDPIRNRVQCIRVDYGDVQSPLFTIFAHVEDSRIWCEEAGENNGICRTIRSLEDIATLDCNRGD